MKKITILYLFLIILTGCSSVSEQSTLLGEIENSIPSDFVTVMYRETPVNVADPVFENLNTSKSTWIRGAWYDNSNEYMIINLEGTYYHYCGMPEAIWRSYNLSDSYGSSYHEMIKGNYDCREGYVPLYF